MMIDIETAAQVPGFVSFISHIDVPGSNKTGYVVHDEEVFVSSITPCIGAIIGVVICDTEESSHIASNRVKIEYELLTPTILTIEDAITNESFFGKEECLRQGDIERGFSEGEHTLEGTVLVGAQEHFYMETNSYIAIPSNDDNELTLYSSTQNPSKTQELVALALGRDASQIICHVKRIGGGFGGKESRG
jgi:xanthine dehydrogenase/oxidase